MPASFTGIFAEMESQISKIVGVVISLSLKVQAHGNRPSRPLSPEDSAKLEKDVEDLSNLLMTTQLNQKLHFKIKESLKLLLSDGTTPIATRTPIVFSSPFVGAAKKIYDQFESLHWAPQSENAASASLLQATPSLAEMA